MADESKPSPLDKLPPPSFSLLVMTYASQAAVAFGHAPNPLDGQTGVRIDLAKHAIAMLVVLEDKTKGNLTPEEATLLENVLHELRLAYIEATAKK